MKNYLLNALGKDLRRRIRYACRNLRVCGRPCVGLSFVQELEAISLVALAVTQ